ncbi:WD40 repeat domain-containing protein [Frankia sp. CcWB3]
MSTATIEAPLWQARIDETPVAVSAASGLLAVAGADGTCAIHQADTGEPAASLSVDGGLLDAAFSPDGAHLALTGPTGYRLWHTTGQQPTGQQHSPYGTAGWSARARWYGANRVAVACGRHVRVHAADGSLLWCTGPAPSTVTDLAWLRAGREVVAAAYRYARHSTDPVEHLRYPGSHLAIAVGANDRWVCTGNQDRSVHIWRTRDRQELEMPGYLGKVTQLAFDPTGRWLANNGAPDVTVWDFAGKGPGGSKPRLLRGHDTITALAWQPATGAGLATCGADATAALWRVTAAAPGRPARPAHRFDLDAPATALTWLDQRRILIATRAGTLYAFDTGAYLEGGR